LMLLIDPIILSVGLIGLHVGGVTWYSTLKWPFPQFIWGVAFIADELTFSIIFVQLHAFAGEDQL
jgi:hypothetical protein